ncbi:hypothetical protein [Rubrivirga sp.]|uniref:hypothetical protein n=1 Tax=Rubrivirga sp. TaxID=1885344 RepID=UPI003B52E001
MRALLVLLGVVVLAGSARGQQRYVIPLAEDTLLFVENQGATRILGTLNGVPFKLVANPEEAARSDNAYVIPDDGDLTLDIAAYMGPGDDANVIEFISQGPPGSGFRFVLAPVYVDGQQAPDYTLADLVPLPSAFGLVAGPNPFRDRLRVSYTVPERRITGLPVRVAVYDVLGRLVDTLVDDTLYPGTFTAEWAGAGSSAASGTYVVRLLTDEGSQVAVVTLAR